MAKKKDELDEKILDVDASMQGTITFRDPVNLRINGSFDGKLDTRGVLTIGEKARVKANITGDTVIVAGNVTGDIIASQKLVLVNPAHVQGNVRTSILSVSEGAILHGNCEMTSGKAPSSGDSDFLSLEEMARFIEVEPKVLADWAKNGNIPAAKDGSTWKFKRSEIDRWLQEERVKI